MTNKQRIMDVIKEELSKLDKKHEYSLKLFGYEGEDLLRVTKRTAVRYEDVEVENANPNTITVDKMLAVRDWFVKRGIVTNTEFSGDKDYIYIDETWYFHYVPCEELIPTILIACTK